MQFQMYFVQINELIIKLAIKLTSIRFFEFILNSLKFKKLSTTQVILPLYDFLNRSDSSYINSIICPENPVILNHERFEISSLICTSYIKLTSFRFFEFILNFLKFKKLNTIWVILTRYDLQNRLNSSYTNCIEIIAKVKILDFEYRKNYAKNLVLTYFNINLQYSKLGFGKNCTNGNTMRGRVGKKWNPHY